MSSLQSPAPGELRNRPRQFESRDDHDGSADGGPHLHRAAHGRFPPRNHPPRASRRASADARRADRAQSRARPRRCRHPAPLQGRADRRHRGSHPQGRGSRAVQTGHGGHRTGFAQIGHRPYARRGVWHRAPARHLAAHHPPRLHARRHRRRHRPQRSGIPRNRPARSRRLPQQRNPHRGIAARLERIRNGGDSRQAQYLRHRLLHRKSRSHGRPYRRFHYRGTGTDPHRSRIPNHARRLSARHGGHRRRNRRLQCPVGHPSADRTHGHHRNEPARLALLRARLQGNRIPDRENRRPPGGRLYARRAPQRYYAVDPRLLRAGARLRRRQSASLHLRKIPGRRQNARHPDEIGRRGHGHRTLLPRSLPKGPAFARNRHERLRRRCRPSQLANALR